MSNEKIEELVSWRDADRVLVRIGRLQQRLARLRTRADQRIALIETRLDAETNPLRDELNALKREIESFFRTNSDGLRSRTLPSGRIGLRRVLALEVARPGTTLHRLAERGMGDCIRLRQELDRQTLRRLDEDTLRGLGVKRKVREVFYAIPGGGVTKGGGK